VSIGEEEHIGNIDGIGSYAVSIGGWESPC